MIQPCRIAHRFDYRWLITSALFALILINHAQAQTTAFTYQGKLADNGTPANNSYDMQFRLFDNPTAGQGTQQGATITNPTVQVSSGLFTVQLDFGATVFAGATPLYLEVSLRAAGSMGGYTSLAPRQRVTSAPYAVQSLNAMNATNAVNATNATNAANATQLGGVAASQYVVTTDARMSDTRQPTAGSLNYIQNTTNQQAATNFNIGGNGLIGGNLGLGTSAPAAKLHIKGAAEGIRIQGTGTSDANSAYLSFVDSAGTPIGYVGDGSIQDRNLYLGSYVSGIILYTNAGPALTATYGGTVGIGTAFPNPTHKLDVIGGDYDGVYGLSNSNLGYAGVFGENLGNDSGGPGVFGRSINRYGVKAYSENSYGLFAASPNSFAGYFQGNVHVTGTITQGSDARLKQSVTTLSYGLPEVLRLRPVTWRWKERADRALQLGLIAQEVEKVLPELVTPAKDAEQTKGLNYTGLLPVLIKAIQEQQQQIEALKKLVCADHPNAEVCKPH